MRKPSRRLVETSYEVDFHGPHEQPGDLIKISLDFENIKGNGQLNVRFRFPREEALGSKIRYIENRLNQEGWKYEGKLKIGKYLNVNFSLYAHPEVNEDCIVGMFRFIVHTAGSSKTLPESSSIQREYEVRIRDSGDLEKWVSEAEYLLERSLVRALPLQ